MQTRGKKLQMNGILHNTTLWSVNGVKSISNFGRMRFASHIWVCICPRRTYLKSLPSSDAHTLAPWGPLDIALHPILFTLTSHLYLEYFPMQNILQPSIQDWLVQAALGISLKSFQAKEACTWYVEAKKKQTVLRSTSSTSSCLKSKQYQNSSM